MLVNAYNAGIKSRLTWYDMGFIISHGVDGIIIASYRYNVTRERIRQILNKMVRQYIQTL